LAGGGYQLAMPTGLFGGHIAQLDKLRHRQPTIIHFSKSFPFSYLL